MTTGSPPLLIELSAVVVTVDGQEARALTLKRTLAANEVLYALPSGPFAPDKHRTFDLALRAFVREQTGFDIGYVEQLYSFGDDGRQSSIPSSVLGNATPDQARVISIGYLALTPQSGFISDKPALWRDFTSFFPWENWRSGEPEILAKHLRPALMAWSDAPATTEARRLRRLRVDTLFPDEIDHWNEERVLERYELLFEAEQVSEARRDTSHDAQSTGLQMISDHRRILATGLSRLRGKVKYRPVIFELMGAQFTLSELQRALEAISGLSLHKQNFRRGLDRTGFVIPLGTFREDTGGRPAELYGYDVERFRFSPSQGLSLPRA